MNHIEIQNDHMLRYRKATSVLRGEHINKVHDILDEKRKLIDNINNSFNKTENKNTDLRNKYNKKTTKL